MGFYSCLENASLETNAVKNPSYMWIVDSGGANLRSSDTPEAEGA
jgi:hypothetical protein